MPYRDRTEIIRQILDIANEGNATRIKIMYRAFLSHKQVKEYVALLTERDLVRYDPITQTYKTTEKGFRLLQFCNELEGMMRNGLQSPRPSA